MLPSRPVTQIASSRALPRHRKRLLPRVGVQVVLLVEDDEEMRRLLARVLRTDGLHVIEAANGDEAFERLGPWALQGRPDKAPDLIVSDIRLPYFNGIEILECVRVAPERVPVILITGFPDDETLATAASLGAECVLSKPFELADFRRVVRRALRPD